MNTNVRIELSDGDKVKYKDVFRERPTRKNIKARVASLFKAAMGEEVDANGLAFTLNEKPKKGKEAPAAEKKKFTLKRKK